MCQTDRKIHYTWNFYQHQLNLIETKSVFLFELFDKNYDDKWLEDVLQNKLESQLIHRIYLPIDAFNWFQKKIDNVLKTYNYCVNKQYYTTFTGDRYWFEYDLSINSNYGYVYHLEHHHGATVERLEFNDIDLTRFRLLKPDIIQKFFKIVEQEAEKHISSES